MRWILRRVDTGLRVLPIPLSAEQIEHLCRLVKVYKRAFRRVRSGACFAAEGDLSCSTPVLQVLGGADVVRAQFPGICRVIAVEKLSNLQHHRITRIRSRTFPEHAR